MTIEWNEMDVVLIAGFVANNIGKKGKESDDGTRYLYRCSFDRQRERWLLQNGKRGKKQCNGSNPSSNDGGAKAKQ